MLRMSQNKDAKNQYTIDAPDQTQCTPMLESDRKIWCLLNALGGASVRLRGLYEYLSSKRAIFPFIAFYKSNSRTLLAHGCHEVA